MLLAQRERCTRLALQALTKQVDVFGHRESEDGWLNNTKASSSLFFLSWAFNDEDDEKCLMRRERERERERRRSKDEGKTWPDNGLDNEGPTFIYHTDKKA